MLTTLKAKIDWLAIDLKLKPCRHTHLLTVANSPKFVCHHCPNCGTTISWQEGQPRTHVPGESVTLNALKSFLLPTLALLIVATTYLLTFAHR
jgi:hypothetical protein